MTQRIITGSPTGSPATISKMLEFAARHEIEPAVEHFPMSKLNDAIAHLCIRKGTIPGSSRCGFCLVCEYAEALKAFVRQISKSLKDVQGGDIE